MIIEMCFDIFDFRLYFVRKVKWGKKIFILNFLIGVRYSEFTLNPLLNPNSKLPRVDAVAVRVVQYEKITSNSSKTIYKVN